MSKIILYKQLGCKGDWKEFVNNIPDLATEVFTKVARSLKVEGNHWVAFVDKDFTGQFMVYGAGEHHNLESMDKMIVSLRLVKENLRNPGIVLYQHVNFNGQFRKIDEEVKNLKEAGFQDLVSSHVVKEGVWILYKDFDFSGKRLITFKDDNWSDYRKFGWNDKMSSLKPLQNSDFEV